MRALEELNDRYRNLNPGEIRWLGDVQRLVLQPDDIIVLSVDSAINAETAERIRGHVETAIPGRKCLVLSNGMRIGVLSPQEATA